MSQSALDAEGRVKYHGSGGDVVVQGQRQDLSGGTSGTTSDDTSSVNPNLR